MPRPVAVVLLGPPGAGKTHAGRLAAEKSGLSFADLDDEIARAHGAPLARLFRRGELVFREHEIGALARWAQNVDVLAAGAGIVDTARARALLAQLSCVHLDVDEDTALARLRNQVSGHRPWLAGFDPASLFRAREAPRARWRTALASARVSGREPLDDVVDALAAAIVSARG